jgi:hypothetical protein
MKIEGKEKIVLAAVLGGTNLGMNLPKKEEVQFLLSREEKTRRPLDIETATMTLWSGYMENDEMQETFFVECRWWLKDNLKRRECRTEYVKAIWPDVARVMGWE